MTHYANECLLDLDNKTWFQNVKFLFKRKPQTHWLCFMLRITLLEHANQKHQGTYPVF